MSNEQQPPPEATPSNSDNNNNNTNNNNSLTSSWMSWFQSFQDDQRLERLQHCRQLDTILKNCRAKQQQQSEDGTSTTTTTNENDKDHNLESCSQGLRTMKYYGWRGILLDEKKDDDTSTDATTDTANADDETVIRKKNQIRERIQSTCSREEHAVWACRAVATGCGKELGALKTCFDKEGPFDVLTAPFAGYEVKKNQSNKDAFQLPCQDLQAALGRCVNTNGKELYQRRKQQQQQQQHKK